MIRGSCCCGTVSFEIKTKPTMMGVCHCNRCRKTGLGTMVFVQSDAFTLLTGRDSISVYKAQPPYKYDRCFCSQCGSALGEILSDQKVFPVAANCFDDPLDIEVQFHEFVGEKPEWHKIGDSGKQFEGHPKFD